VVFESGALQPDGSIAGNDNDVDATRFEPHYSVIDRPDEVQIYESIMGDAQGRVTTGLLSAINYRKDNRLLPDGFDKQTAAAEVAVRGEAPRIRTSRIKATQFTTRLRPPRQKRRCALMCNCCISRSAFDGPPT